MKFFALVVCTYVYVLVLGDFNVCVCWYLCVGTHLCVACMS